MKAERHNVNKEQVERNPVAMSAQHIVDLIVSITTVRMQAHLENTSSHSCLFGVSAVKGPQPCLPTDDW